MKKQRENRGGVQRHKCEVGKGMDWWMCYEHKDGTLNIETGRHAVPANFCPVCGYKAKVESIER